MLNPETLATISVCGALALMLLLAWRLWVQLSKSARSSAGPAWEHRGPDAVWDVCDTWRDADLGIKYLEPRIARLDATSRAVDIIIAVSTASSVSSLALFRDFWWGVYAWKCLAGIGGLLAVVKPFLRFQDIIKNRQELLKAYTVLFAECEKVIYIIRSTKKYDEMTHDLYEKARERFQANTSSLTMETTEIRNLPEEKRKTLMARVENALSPTLMLVSIEGKA